MKNILRPKKPEFRLAQTDQRRPSLPFRKMRLPKVSKRHLLVSGLVLICGAAGLGGGFLGAELNESDSASIQSQAKFISSESSLIAAIAKEAGQSVVSVDVSGEVTTRNIFGDAQTQARRSAGSGFIITSDGVVVTNRHVVPEGTNSVSVTLADGTLLDNVDVIGRTNNSSSLDIAFLKIKDSKGKQLKPLKLGDSSKVEVGEKVIAIGNALGQFANTVTSGIISGYGRDLVADGGPGTTAENLDNLFQTDAAINEGNSGGPLVNVNGEVIGVNTAVADQAQNIGFAIPINDFRGLITSVTNNGELVQTFLGIRYVNLTNDVAAELGLKNNRGVYIQGSAGESAVVPGSPAEKSGLKEGDVITSINQKEINEKNSLSSLLSSYKVGDTVRLNVVRDGTSRDINVTLAEMPASL